MDEYHDPVSLVCVDGLGNAAGNRIVVVYDPVVDAQLSYNYYKWDDENQKIKFEPFTDDTYVGVNNWELRIRINDITMSAPYDTYFP